MALHGAVTITATKIKDAGKEAYTYNGSGKDIILITSNIKKVTPIGESGEDSLYELMDGTLIWGVRSFDDTSNEISSSDLTGS